MKRKMLFASFTNHAGEHDQYSFYTNLWNTSTLWKSCHFFYSLKNKGFWRTIFNNISM